MDSFKENNVYIGIGSNLGNRLVNIELAIEKINENYNCEVVEVSSVYESKPLGNTEQQNFYNAAAMIKTNFEPRELLYFLKQIEKELGREKNSFWEPRTIDLDILFFNDLNLFEDGLKIPHKEILNRDFVIIPLIEINPEIAHPVENKRLTEICILESKRHILGKLPHSTLI